MIINDILINASLEEILEELVRQLRFNDIQYLGKMKPSGRNIQVSCPYHSFGEERKPSMGIRKSDGIGHCFTCNQTHTLPELISFCFGHTNDMIGSFGWKWILKNFATVEVEDRKDVELDFMRNTNRGKHKSSNNVSAISNDNAISDNNYVTEEELDSYRYYHPYMQKRKMTDEVIEMYDIGYDKISKSLTFPCRDKDGNCLFIARRSVNSKYFHIPQATQKPLYGVYECYKYSKPFPDEIVVCEGMIDAITVHVHDSSKFGVALFGVGNALQMKQLRELPCRKIILATDADNAGMQARERIRKSVPNKLITQYVWDKEMAKDINDMTQEQFLSLKEEF